MLLRSVLASYEKAALASMLCVVPASTVVGSACGFYTGLHVSQELCQKDELAKQQTVCLHVAMTAGLTVYGGLCGSVLGMAASVMLPAYLPLYAASTLSNALDDAGDAFFCRLTTAPNNKTQQDFVEPASHKH
jgi:hypothetical protein